MADPSIERFRKVVASACALLEARRQEVNDLNVFPVADGDTGDNMVQTLRAVMLELDRLNGKMVDEGGHQLAHIQYPGLPADDILSAVHRFYDEYYFRPKAVFRILKNGRIIAPRRDVGECVGAEHEEQLAGAVSALVKFAERRRGERRRRRP